jgi:poly-gamma-glutamate capsule biosynthesis protein CapA/YwtB (metallophosphatase superfamily)
MSRKNIFYQIALVIFIIFACVNGAYAKNKNISIAFTGDLLLGRIVAKEAKETGRKPWVGINDELKKWDYLVSNFEGTIGEANSADRLCFAINENDLKSWGKLPVNAISFENNHTYDLGEAGRKTTQDFLNIQGIETITWEKSPKIVEIEGYKIALISFNQVRLNDKENNDFYEKLLQKINLSKLLADIVVLNIHWGIELQTWPNDRMRKDAKWFIDNGVDVIIGHHPHVIIPPSVYKNRPIFYSLGNFIFDQKYDETKQGLIAVCNLKEGKAGFEVYKVHTPSNSTLPHIIVKEDAHNVTLKNAGFKINREIMKYGDIEVRFETDKDNEIYLRFLREQKEIWRSRALPVISAYKSSLRPKIGKDVLILIEEYFSTIDKEKAPRPYVYEITEHGLRALWRGSALAWPLIDICIFNSRENDYMGAFHRGDNFIELNPEIQKRRIAFYTWNGFGFNITEEIPGIIEEEAKRRWRQ